LLKQALEFCTEVGYKTVYLWTFRDLDAARSLCEHAGFRLREEHDVNQRRRKLTEQMFEINLDGFVKSPSAVLRFIFRHCDVL
jgi:hypothetical protein